ncbi:UDP-N-acetylmuramyl pentapeptide phosphotransferase/UDP-N-acetylglucosamine-1-phosphate transferase [Hymenobacter daecheongensis DSM 21074]|uniref:UDP-N-acetylmuramyl pentapeptide phosphotransferase/UDP-N-acetylglucosamine-1-phosphate transferase n=1 Tax=Hymenobacter daecheongensis DSM 21074 TaxID=1121955 RepID=A0A1M6ACB6_9BACT|nr:MraY family glycosyltransferase [Hymenobacter daecheongensis]SHI34105.1 UDP-N-acetylmuramyl pentapeptide phosphotransferase/UDP-N-acetylglucosamine-1-phosphate transferase [Hymenobacter daecheongensis DSM 21074]
MNPIGIQLGLSFLWAFLVALFAVPSIIYIAHLKNMLDTPNVRTVHESLTPRLGGVAVFAGFMSALTIFADLGNGIQQLLAGCIVLFFVGLKDDLVSISVAKKFVGQLLATGIVMIMADIRVTSFQGILGIHELPIGISYAFTFLAIVGITNAINLIDGLDGLAGTIVLIITSTYGYYFLRYGGAGYGNYVFVAVCLIGGLLGFLRYNFHRASIFMGDTGSLVCGFIVSILTIQFIEMGLRAGQPFGSSSPSVAIGILFVPLFDTLRIFIVRMLGGRSPFAPDKNHVHHRILAMGFQQISTVVLLALLNLVVILFVINFAAIGNTWLIVGMVAFSVVLSIFLGVYQSRSAQQRVTS